MASLTARATRNRAVRDRLNAALLRISKRLDIPIPDESRRMRDADLQPIVELERFADFAESVDNAIANLASADEAPGGYDALTVPMLRAEIERRELEIPSGAKKADLIFILTEDDFPEQVGTTEEEPDESDAKGEAGEDAADVEEPTEEPDGEDQSDDAGDGVDQSSEDAPVVNAGEQP